MAFAGKKVNQQMEPNVQSKDSQATESLAELTARHKRESKELASQITGLKRSVPKGDRKRRKDAQMEATRLETEQRERHAVELERFKASQDASKLGDDESTARQNVEEEYESDDEKLLAKLDAMRIEEERKEKEAVKQATPKKKPNRQKLRKEREEARIREMEEAAEKEASEQTDMRAVENSEIRKLTQTMGLSMKEIKPDGHCLYNAISDQLIERHNISKNYNELRRAAANYMREHRDEFLPFMETPTDEDFVSYCDDLENTATWGGELEIRAISKMCQLPVHVVQMGAPVLKVSEEEFPGREPICLSYHKHMYTLGAHYNSLRSS